MSTEPLLHWQLDDIAPGNVVVDYAPGKFDGTVEGTPTVQPDDQFGACLFLGGDPDALVAPSTLPSFTAYTMCAWVRFPPRAEGGAIIGRGSAKLWANYLGGLQHNVPAGDQIHGQATGPGAIRFGVWHHVAVTRAGATARVYVDGRLVVESNYEGAAPALAGTLAVGREPGSPTGHATMSVAAVRVYDGALDAEQIQEIVAEDETAAGAFVRTHPLAFELVNVDEQPVLYIDDAVTAQTMTLRVTNSSRHDLTLWPIEGPASATDHHLSLTWRAGTLAAASQPVVNAAGWTLNVTDDRDVCYLRGPASVIPAGKSIELPLTGLRADGTDGTRGTRVQLGYQRLGYTGETSELTGTRQQVLEVVNHRGRPDIPLDVGFVGGNRVLSDGVSTSSLRLRVANVSRTAPIALTGSGTVGKERASALVLSFDLQLANEVREWALTTAAQVGSVKVQLVGAAGVAWDIDGSVFDERAQWTLTPRADTTLPPEAWLELAIGLVHGLASPGHAPVVLAYRNIPGYQDGFVSAEVERAPLLFTATNAGLGTPNPKAKLHIVGTATGAHIGSLIIGPVDQPNLRLGHDQTYVWMQSHGNAPLAINPVGNNVSIGTTTPQTARLTVRASAEHLQLRREVVSAGGNQLYLELFQSDTPSDVVTYPSIRFHHWNKFWHRIEGRPEGIMVKWGPTTSDSLSNLYAARGVFTSLAAGGVTLADNKLTIGGVSIGEAELRALARLVAGALEFDLLNVAAQEYICAAPSHMFDIDWRHVFSWRGTTKPPSTSRWRLVAPA